MIVDILITILNVLLRVFNAIIPNWTLPDAFVTSLSYFGVYVAKFSWLFPIPDFLVVVGIAISIEIVILLIRVGSGILSFFRGGGRIDI